MVSKDYAMARGSGIEVLQKKNQMTESSTLRKAIAI
jgi:hypothetical protein